MKNGNGNEKKKNPKGTVVIRGVEHKLACFSCHEIYDEFAQMHITDPKLKRAFGLLMLCEKCSKALHAGTLQMQPPSTYPTAPKGNIINFPPGTGKKPKDA